MAPWDPGAQEPTPRSASASGVSSHALRRCLRARGYRQRPSEAPFTQICESLCGRRAVLLAKRHKRPGTSTCAHMTEASLCKQVYLLTGSIVPHVGVNEKASGV